MVVGVLFLILISNPVYAHKVNMFAYVEGNKVFMEGYFADGNKPVNCEVVVTNPAKKVLVKGLTDQEGRFSFDVPEITDLRIALNAGMGHRAEFVVSRSELTGVSPAAGQQTTPIVSKSAEVEPPAFPEQVEDGTAAASGIVSEAVIRKAVADANLPLLRAIDELKERANFGNIVGGIGFIFGIVGIFFYAKARKMLSESGGRAPTVK